MVDAITGFIVGKMGDYLIKEASMLMTVKDDLEELKTELTCIHCYLKDVEAREREKMRSQRRGLMRLANKIGEKKDAYNIGDDSRSLKRRILDITRKRETYGVGRFKEPGGDMTTRVASGEELERIKMFTEEEELEAYLHDLLDGRRYLVVVDDIWKQDAWESLTMQSWRK
ncbi:hypothetical protein Bca52824_087235 [Brassica carinata]|uniref:NB-ARC domain-containing protein n=1 Tax=Brassica carinata TaxID=52824 RepID=A0A8X7TMR8_BRACI|nr:hypothetical protein Bca52824_087235 [Brassica carinata]